MPGPLSEKEKHIDWYIHLPGHVPSRDLQMIPTEKVQGHFRRKERESFHIRRLDTVKRQGVTEVEQDMSLNAVQL